MQQKACVSYKNQERWLILENDSMMPRWWFWMIMKMHRQCVSVSVFVCRKPCQASIHDLHLVRQRIYLRYVFDYVLTWKEDALFCLIQSCYTKLLKWNATILTSSIFHSEWSDLEMSWEIDLKESGICVFMLLY
jgi:hypothetical protein